MNKIINYLFRYITLKCLSLMFFIGSVIALLFFIFKYKPESLLSHIQNIFINPSAEIESIKNYLSSNLSFFGDLGSVVLVFTLWVITIYTYYTKRLTEIQVNPVASFSMQQFGDSAYKIAFIIQNHSQNILMNCRCKLNARVGNQDVDLGGFYSGETKIPVQPSSRFQGWYDIKNIINKSTYSFEHIKKEAKSGEKKWLYMNVEFEYESIDKEFKSKMTYPYFFDFKREVLVLDF